MNSQTAAILRHLTLLRFEDLPPEVLTVAKRNILDTLLVGRAGARAEGLEAMVSLAQGEAKPGLCTVWARDGRLPPAYAAQINAMAAAALDFDSLCLTAHTDCVVVPAAIAAAETSGASGKALLTAYVAGTEIIARLSRAAVPPQKGWTHTSVFGVFGATLAAARLFGLSDTETTHAFGISLSLAAGSQQSNIEQTLTKRLQPALAARNGIFAALSARAGITGPACVLEGKAGLWALYQKGCADRLLDGLGHEYVLLQTGLKEYPVCACSHAAIEACLGLTGGRGLREDDIERVDVTVTPFMTDMVGGAFDPSQNPVVAAQFSIRYAIAAALLRGHVDLSDLTFDAITDASIKRLADRIRVHTDQSNGGEVEPATVCLKLAGQDERTLTVNVIPGSPAAPLSADAFLTKLRACERAQPFDARLGGLPALQRTVQRLEELGDLKQLGALLGGGSSQAGRSSTATNQ